jgi:hypothetical protein
MSFRENNKNMDAKWIPQDCDNHLGYIDQLFCHFKGINIRWKLYFGMCCIVKEPGLISGYDKLLSALSRIGED